MFLLASSKGREADNKTLLPFLLEADFLVIFFLGMTGVRKLIPVEICSCRYLSFRIERVHDDDMMSMKSMD